MILPYHT